MLMPDDSVRRLLLLSPLKQMLKHRNTRHTRACHCQLCTDNRAALSNRRPPGRMWPARCFYPARSLPNFVKI